MYQPTIKQLKYVCAVAKYKHFSKAANSCYVSQSALSTGINELEQQLGIRIFERHNKSVLITPLGEKLIERAQKILIDIHDFVSLSQEQDGFMRQLHLGIIPTIAPFMLPKMLSSINKKFPNTDVLLREDLSHNLLELLNKGEFDAVLLALPFNTLDFKVAELFSDPLVLATPINHSMEKLKQIKFKDLQGVKMLLMDDGHCLRDQTLGACNLSINDIDLPYQASSLHTLIQMVVNGIGVAMIPEMAIKTEIVDQKKISLRRFDSPNVSRTIALVWRNNHPNQDSLEALANMLKR